MGLEEEDRLSAVGCDSCNSCAKLHKTGTAPVPQLAIIPRWPCNCSPNDHFLRRVAFPFKHPADATSSVVCQIPSVKHAPGFLPYIVAYSLYGTTQANIVAPVTRSLLTHQYTTMAGSNGYSFKDKPVFDLNPQRHGRRQLLLYICAALWLAISVYPVYLYWVDNSSLRPRPKTSRMVVTETIAVPALSDEAVPGHLPSRGYDPSRLTDATDGFKHFKQDSQCSLNSLELHAPFEPLCTSKDNLLEAMSGGGRIGHDAPYSPRGCDMRWFSSSEICQIMNKFEKVFIVGDSMMRNLAVAVHVFLRADLSDGARTTWKEDPEGIDCSCRGPFETIKCAYHSVVGSKILVEHAPESLYCDAEGFGGFEYNAMLEYPIKAFDIQGLTKWLAPKRPKRPYAFVFGHGLWNDLDKEKTFAWIDQLMDGIAEDAPYLVHGKGAFFPRLFLTPSAAGVRKPEVFVGRQGNIAIAKFEKAVAPFVRHRGLDHLGTYNMSIQATNPDGTHGGMNSNLIKAMMVFNWLNSLSVPESYEPGKSEEGH
ncbi:hypothetical protein FH972_023275 [Carpinus fangiana]|uniref:Uncharacterized protein n=1 Tax=Carpinus fangiana TaxID=176857 RepID=A0A5N6KUQ3_9ROSI|nr:hypothetical protein FH972_023275 [Carpinus fangiana]